MQERMKTVWPIMREHMVQAQEAQRRVYNHSAQPGHFNPGDRVLVLVPTSECKFLGCWQNEIREKLTDVTYRVRQPGRRPVQIYHINLLKKWVACNFLLSSFPTGNFAAIAFPLTELTKNNQLNFVQWTEEADLAFVRLKEALSGSQHQNTDALSPRDAQRAKVASSPRSELSSRQGEP
ncbi:hypothetical protein SKAU_G00060810 [Synaphobranchus kaupii]|uniref:Integrase p58-like C-terminal domain-containing protein n=1 Tax=Synaphobranchus kaupii TaxID=118154 RepID=A0A9Q1G5Q0_SYNKA|nr:hypothetical protein SKAU_G00060810 [Synaphobranchus kaupii]